MLCTLGVVAGMLLMVSCKNEKKSEAAAAPAETPEAIAAAKAEAIAQAKTAMKEAYAEEGFEFEDDELEFLFEEEFFELADEGEELVADAVAKEVEVPEEEEEEEELIVEYYKADVKPTFGGGDANAFSKWLAENLQYPEDARQAKVEGRVILSFTIDEDGSIANPRVLKGADPSLDNEALRTLATAPKWEPGRNAAGDPVKIHYVMPVVFKLQ